MNHALITLSQVTVDPMASVDRYGLPIALLVVIGFALRQVGRFFAPIATRVAEKHVEFLEAAKTQTERTADAVEVISKEHGSLLKSIHTAVTKAPI